MITISVKLDKDEILSALKSHIERHYKMDASHAYITDYQIVTVNDHDSLRSITLENVKTHEK